jgi:hypothetical protein
LILDAIPAPRFAARRIVAALVRCRWAFAQNCPPEIDMF